MNGSGMAKYMWTDVAAPGSSRRCAQTGRVAANDLVDAKPRKSPPAVRDEHGSSRSFTVWMIVDQSLEDFGGLLP
jgi:hypothetical protein